MTLNDISKRYISTHLNINPHLSNSETIREYLEFIKVDEIDIKKCEIANSVVTLQGYRNSCGFDFFVGISIDEVLKMAGEHFNKKN